jgi:hypothetical protein
MNENATESAADRALRKLRWFMTELDPDERSALAALIAPGVEAALAADPIHEWAPDLVRRWLGGPAGRPPNPIEPR